MSKSRQKLEQELAQDEVAEGFIRALTWLKDNKYRLMGWGALIVILLGILMTHNFMRKSNLSGSNALLDSAMEQLLRVDSATSETLRLEAFNALETSANNLEKGYKGTVLGLYGNYLKGLGYMRLDRYEDARNAFNAFLSSTKDKELQAIAQLAIGYTYENEAFTNMADAASTATLSTDTTTTAPLKSAVPVNDLLKQSIAAYTVVADAPKTYPSYLVFYAKLCNARVEEVLGNTDAAIALYQQIIAQRPAEVSTFHRPEQTNADQSDLRMREEIFDHLVEREGELSFTGLAQTHLDQLRTAKRPMSPIEEIVPVETPEVDQGNVINLGATGGSNGNVITLDPATMGSNEPISITIPEGGNTGTE